MGSGGLVRARLGVLVVGVGLALVGCKSEPAGAGAGGEPAAPTAGGSDRLGLRDLDFAARDFLEKVDEQAAKGWPADVKLSTDTVAPRPLARVRFTNKTMESIDGDAWAGRMSDLILERGSLAVLSPRPADPETDGALIVDVEVSDERMQANGVTSVAYWFHIALIDPATRQVIVTSRSKLRKGS
jgi:hypothetical protein